MNTGTLVLRELRPREAKSAAQSHTAYDGQSKDWELSKSQSFPTLAGHDSGGQPWTVGGDTAPCSKYTQAFFLPASLLFPCPRH